MVLSEGKLEEHTKIFSNPTLMVGCQTPIVIPIFKLKWLLTSVCVSAVDGEYVEEGWVDKTCKICKKDTRGQARQVDNFGRYVHTACLDDKSKSGGNFFTRLFS